MSVTDEYKITLLGFGEVGRVLAEDLLDATTAKLRIWDHQLTVCNSRASAHLAQFRACERIEVAGDAVSAAQDAQLVISAVTADQAVLAAASIAPGLPAGCWFLDVNSISPGNKQRVRAHVEAVAGRFVEASIMSPIHPKRMASPILLAGPDVEAFVPLGHSIGFSQLRVVSERPGIAAATKMCRSVMIKGLEALVSESLLTARHYGVEQDVLDSLGNLLPGIDWQQHAHYLISRTLLHGERRAAEMREVATTVSEAGVTPWMSAHCAERQAWAPQFKSALDAKSLTDMLDSIREQMTASS